MANEPFQARLYGEKLGDYQLVNEWAVARGLTPLLETLLPPIGVIVERAGVPMCALWCYESYGIGSALIDHAVSSPGLSVEDARGAFGMAIASCVTLAKSHGDYGHFRCFTSDACGRVLKSLGWQCTSEPVREYTLTQL